ncbi:hypothetical protein X975_14980, partial [Stegodyphus mimosarum]
MVIMLSSSLFFSSFSLDFHLNSQTLLTHCLHYPSFLFLVCIHHQNLLTQMLLRYGVF